MTTKQEILDYLDNVLHPIVSPDNWDVYANLYDMIEELPSAEPKRGKWMLWNEPGNEYAYCSVCNAKFDQSDLYIGGTDYPKYCPECGADMRESE